MEIQVQCPNCGGYRVSNTGETPVFGENRPYGLGCQIFQILAGIFFLTPIIFGFFALGGLTIAREVGLLIGTVIGITVLLILWPRWIRTMKEGSLTIKGYVHHYYCYLCGYKWSEGMGVPKPVVHVRPELIAKGEQRLQEEQAAAEAARANAIAQDVLRRQGVIK